LHPENIGVKKKRGKIFMKFCLILLSCAVCVFSSPFSQTLKQYTSRITGRFQSLQKFYDPLLLQKGLELVNTEEIFTEQRKIYSEYKERDSPISMEMALARAMISWVHKNMVWMDSVRCECGSETKATGLCYGSLLSASHFEVRMCKSDGKSVIIPRFTNPIDILTHGEKRGRCGEYTDVAFMVAILVGLEPRFLYDYTDHVWIEVKVDGRWLHLDNPGGKLRIF
jgi:hypothetical protein